MRYLTSADIHQHRQEVTDQCRTFFQPMYCKFDAAIDALLLIQYALRLPEEPVTTPLQRVNVAAQKWLYSSIFTFHGSLALAEQGFYTQSISLNRNLMECLVTVRYLADKPKHLDRLPMVSRKVQQQLTMRDRFEYVIPGYYDPHYKLSSEFAHPSHGSHILKIQPNGAGGYDIDLGISFNKDLMSFCLNEFAMLLVGFLKAYPTKFKKVLHFRSTSEMDRIEAATGGLLEILYAHIALKGGENDWHKTTRPLWDWRECDQL